jgi:hypothetical protein
VLPGDGVRPRQCGRCRQFFEGDPAEPPDVIAEWWLCPPCREVLLGHGSRRPTRPIERAQAVWQAALDRAGDTGPEDRLALDLLRVADRDAATMAHALVIGRTRLVLTPEDAASLQAVDTLDRAIGFLGVRPEPNAAL